MSFLSIFKHLLPSGRAWRITADKMLRGLFVGLSAVGDELKAFVDLVWLDIFPGTTREISEWENQFGLRPGQLTEVQRRTRLAATWAAMGGQSPRYIQDTLRANGFNVYVHEWWELVGGIPVARDPLSVLAPDNITPVVGRGYPLVNKIAEVVPDIIACCGEAEAACGEAEAACFNYVTLRCRLNRWYITNTTPFYRSYYLYIGGETYGALADIPAERRDEFENLCLKVCPLQQWIGLIVRYV